MTAPPALPATVGIVMRTKNRPLLLERALNDVLRQVFTDWTMVIVNDGGDPAPVDDLVRRYAEAFRGRVAVVHNRTSVGMEGASNIGIRATDSRYVVLHDDDDTWDPEFLQATVDFLERDSVHEGVITRARIVYEALRDGAVVVERDVPLNPEINAVSLGRILHSNFFPVHAFLYRRKALDTVGLYREDLPVLGDWDFNIRFLARFDIALIDRALAFWHQRPGVDGSPGNSIFNACELHARYDAAVRNRWLRDDLAAQRHGVGQLLQFRQTVVVPPDHRVLLEDLHRLLIEQRDHVVHLLGAGIERHDFEIKLTSAVFEGQEALKALLLERHDFQIKLMSAIFEGQQALQALLLERHDFLIKMTSAIYETQQGLRQRLAEAENARIELERVRSSVSWRMTKPLRTLGRLLRAAVSAA